MTGQRDRRDKFCFEYAKFQVPGVRRSADISSAAERAGWTHGTGHYQTPQRVINLLTCVFLWRAEVMSRTVLVVSEDLVKLLKLWGVCQG